MIDKKMKETGRSKSYKLEDKCTLNNEKERLRKQASVFFKAELPIFQTEEIKSDSVILDIGCGNGSYINALMDIYPSCTYYGIDHNKDLLEQAKQNLPNANFFLADIFSDELIDIISSISPNFIILRFVLQHLNPIEIKKVIHTIFTSLKTSSVLFIIDTVDSEIRFFPETSAFDNLIERKTALQRADGGDRNIGHNLIIHLTEYPWRETICKTIDVGSSINDWKTLKDVLLPIYTSRINLELKCLETAQATELSKWFDDCPANPEAYLHYPIKLITIKK